MTAAGRWRVTCWAERCEFDAIERLIADTSGRAAALERILGVMHRLGGDVSAADRALMATYETLGLLTSRRARLTSVVDFCNREDSDEVLPGR